MNQDLIFVIGLLIGILIGFVFGVALIEHEAKNEQAKK